MAMTSLCKEDVCFELGISFKMYCITESISTQSFQAFLNMRGENSSATCMQRERSSQMIVDNDEIWFASHHNVEKSNLTSSIICRPRAYVLHRKTRTRPRKYNVEDNKLVWRNPDFRIYKCHECQSYVLAMWTYIYPQRRTAHRRYTPGLEKTSHFQAGAGRETARPSIYENLLDMFHYQNTRQ